MADGRYAGGMVARAGQRSMMDREKAGMLAGYALPASGVRQIAGERRLGEMRWPMSRISPSGQGRSMLLDHPAKPAEWCRRRSAIRFASTSRSTPKNSAVDLRVKRHG